VRTEIEDLYSDPNFVLDLEKVFIATDEERQVVALQGVLRRWGAIFATCVELGCSLTSTFETSTSIPSVSRIAQISY
jgi:hypothetical protein